MIPPGLDTINDATVGFADKTEVIPPGLDAFSSDLTTSLAPEFTLTISTDALKSLQIDTRRIEHIVGDPTVISEPPKIT